MAESAVTILLENLSQLIIQGSDRLDAIQDEIRDVEEQLQLLEAVIKDIQAGDKPLERETLEQIQHLVFDVEDSISTYITFVSAKAKKGVYPKFLYQAKQREYARTLKKRRNQIEDVIKNLKSHVRLPAGQVEDEPASPEITDQSQVPPPAGQVENLSQLIIQGSDRLDPIQDEIRDVEEQLQLLEAVIKDIQAGDKPLERENLAQIQHLVSDVEDSISTYITFVSAKAKKGVYPKFLYRAKQREYARTLKKRRNQIKNVIKNLKSHVRLPAGHVEDEPASPEITDQSQVPPPAGQVEEEPVLPEITDQIHVPHPVGQVEEDLLPEIIEEPSPEITDQIHVPHPTGQVEEDLLPEITEEPLPETTDQIHVPPPAGEVEEDLPEITDQIHVPPPAGQVEEDVLPEITEEPLPEITDQIPVPHPAGQVEEGLLPQITDQTHVPRSLWRFIFYFLLFPVNCEVPSRRLIVLWAAEGLIRLKKDDDEWDEHIARDNLNKLIDLKLVIVTKKKLNGKVQACKLRDDIRESWMMTAKKTYFFQQKTGEVHQLVDHSRVTEDASFIRIHGNMSTSHLVPKRGEVLSFLSFDTKEGSKPGEDIGDFLDKCVLAGRFIWLRVLDLERVFRPKLSKPLGKLFSLKYLGLRWTYLEKLPSFVNKLFNLQVLDVKHTYISVLPKSIWTMQDLRHLYLSEIYRTRFPDWPSGRKDGCLTHLRTLWGASIDEDTKVEDGLDTLLNIRKLGLSCCSSNSSDMSEKLKAVDNWIAKLRFLDCLRLKSRHGDGTAADLHLSTLEGNKNLSSVYLLGILNPFVVHKFPESITDVTLSLSGLNFDPMEFLGCLPKLQILRLLAQSVVHTKMRCSGGSFPVLKVVYIWKLENLKKWEIEQGALPHLEEVEIRSCDNLETLPAELQNLNSLRKCRLTNMPGTFIDETMLTLPHFWANKVVLD